MFYLNNALIYGYMALVKLAGHNLFLLLCLLMILLCYKLHTLVQRHLNRSQFGLMFDVK